MRSLGARRLSSSASTATTCPTKTSLPSSASIRRKAQRPLPNASLIKTTPKTPQQVLSRQSPTNHPHSSLIRERSIKVCLLLKPPWLILPWMHVPSRAAELHVKPPQRPANSREAARPDPRESPRLPARHGARSRSTAMRPRLQSRAYH